MLVICCVYIIVIHDSSYIINIMKGVTIIVSISYDCLFCLYIYIYIYMYDDDYN